MLATLIIVFRELIEAGLVVGIVLAATKGVPRRSLWVAYGIIGGVLGACLVAAFANKISAAMQGFGQECFNVSILILAIAMLTWHNVWMARHGREMAMEMKSIGEAVAKGQRSLLALSIVVGIAVLREGSEVVLFLYGIAIAGNDSLPTMILGGLMGALLGVTMSTVMYLGLLRIPSRNLFKVTGWMITFLAAGMAAQAAALLQQAGMVNVMDKIIWDTSSFISNDSVIGKILHTLIGYTDQPSLLQLIVYLATLGTITVLMKLFGPSAPAPQAMTIAAE